MKSALPLNIQYSILSYDLWFTNAVPTWERFGLLEMFAPVEHIESELKEQFRAKWVPGFR